MFAARVSLLALIAMALLCQTNGLSERLRHALDGSGDGELAARELSSKEFAPLEQMLAKRAAIDIPKRSELIALTGAVAFLRGDMNAAIVQFGKAAEIAPLKDGDNFTLAMALVNLGDDTRAAAILSSLADKYPRESIYVYWLGRLDYNLRRYPEATIKLQKALELAPKSTRIWDSLGLAFDMQGQTEQAYGALTQAATLNRSLPQPSAWPPHNLGYLCLRVNKLKEAEESLRESLRYDQKLAVAHYHLARVLEGEAREREAVVEYEAAISEDKSSTDACYSLAMLYRRLHQEEEATAMFTEYKKRKEALQPQ